MMHWRCNHVVKTDFCCLLSCCCLSIFQIITPNRFKSGLDLGLHRDAVGRADSCVRSLSLYCCSLENEFASQHTLLATGTSRVLFAGHHFTCAERNGATITPTLGIFLGGTFARLPNGFDIRHQNGPSATLA